MRGIVIQIAYGEKGLYGKIKAENGTMYNFQKRNISKGNRLKKDDQVEFQMHQTYSDVADQISKVAGNGAGSRYSARDNANKGKSTREVKRYSEEDAMVLDGLYQNGQYAEYLQHPCFHERTPGCIPIPQMEHVGLSMMCYTL